jgi:Tol biopolymer transport system component
MKAITLLVLVGLAGRSAADEAGWIRVTADKKVLLFRPDGTERSEAATAPAAARPLPKGIPAEHAVWSPDGLRIAYLVEREGRFQVHVADHDGSNVRQLTHGPHGAWQPKFAPDGRLSYQLYRERLAKARRADLVINDGPKTKIVVENVYITDYAWSPDGKAIVYGKIGALVFLDLATGQSREVALADVNKDLAPHGPVHISWSPDGQAVACWLPFIGGRRHGGPKMFADEKVFVIRRDGKTTWFEPGVDMAPIEWVKSK